MDQALTFDATTDGDVTVVRVKGEIREGIEPVLVRLLGAVRARKLVMDLAGVSVVTSLGISLWHAFAQQLDERADVEYAAVPPVLLHFMASMGDLLGRGVLRSFLLSYYCEGCRRQVSILTEAAELRALFGRSRGCPSCSGVLSAEFDEEGILELTAEGSAGRP